MQGVWVVFEYKVEGGDLVGKFRETFCFRFEGSRLTCTTGDAVCSRWDLTLSPGSAPREITKKEVGGRCVLRGIYRFEGDELVICQDDGEDRRPTEFAV